MEQKRTRKVNLFDTSSSFLSVFMYTTLGILTGLLMTGTLWQILRNNCKTEINNNIISGKCAAVHKKRTRSMASALNSRSRGPPEWRNRVTVWFSWEGLFTLSTKEYEWESVRFQGILTKWLRKTFLWQHLQKPAKWANRIDLTRYRSTAVKALFFSINTCHLGKVVIFLLNTSAKILESRFLSTAVASSAHHSKQKKAKQASIRLDYRCDKILHYELCFLDDGHDCGPYFFLCPSVEPVKERKLRRSEAIQEDLETAKRMLSQIQKHFEKLEAEVLRIWLTSLQIIFIMYIHTLTH